MPSIDVLIEPRLRDLGDGFQVRRVLPHAQRRMVGPFVFLDHFGPVRLPPGQGLDVRPHPHIALATVTYLFDGVFRHRDSLGNDQLLSPGAVNWMTAGRGIVHSERSPADVRAAGPSFHGLQMWVALPRAREEMAPSFQHHDAATIPELTRGAVRLRVAAGAAFGVRSPVETQSPLFCVDAAIPPGGRLTLAPEDTAAPGDAASPTERAVQIVEGNVTCDGQAHPPGRLLVLAPGATATMEAALGQSARVVLIGGAPLDGERHIWWNFVASSRERIERAADDWRAGRFAKIPGDDREFIPLPER